MWVLPGFVELCLGSAWILLGFSLVLPGFGLGSTLCLCDFCLPCLGFFFFFFYYGDARMFNRAPRYTLKKL
jgi:hypothetical protein